MAAVDALLLVLEEAAELVVIADDALDDPLIDEVDVDAAMTAESPLVRPAVAPEPLSP